MEFPELSLAPTQFVVNKSSISSSPESDSNTSRKRKFFNDHSLKTDQAVHTSVDLQLKDPLPLDWEQCLDLEVNLSLSLSLSLSLILDYINIASVRFFFGKCKNGILFQ